LLRADAGQLGDKVGQLARDVVAMEHMPAACSEHGQAARCGPLKQGKVEKPVTDGRPMR
jgi:hypothetical protein